MIKQIQAFASNNNRNQLYATDLSGWGNSIIPSFDLTVHRYAVHLQDVQLSSLLPHV